MMSERAFHSSSITTEGEVNVPACPQRACHWYRSYTASVLCAIAHPGLPHPGLRLTKWPTGINTSRRLSPSSMWIDVACGLLPVGHVYSQAKKNNTRTIRTFAVGARHPFQLGRCFRWTESGHLMHLQLGRLFCRSKARRYTET